MTKEEKQFIREQNKFLKKNPMCMTCMANGFYKKATHAIRHTDGTMFGLCDECYWIPRGRQEPDIPRLKGIQ